eukprot:19170-Heterococcus_DN1.PRE.2
MPHHKYFTQKVSPKDLVYTLTPSLRSRHSLTLMYHSIITEQWLSLLVMHIISSTFLMITLHYCYIAAADKQ